MPNRERGFHALEKVSLIIDGRRITGSGGDLVTFSIEGDETGYTVGSDGHVAVYQDSNDLVLATITVMSTSRAFRQLGALLQQQRTTIANTAQLPEFEFQMRNAATGTEVNEPKAFFTSPPPPDQGQEAQEAEFEMGLPNAKPGIIRGVNNNG